MRYVLTGYHGMMGAEVDRVARSSGWERLEAPAELPRWTDPFSPGRSEPDAANVGFAEWVRDVAPDVVLNAAAIVGSHKAVALGFDVAHRCNVAAAGLLAEAADACGALLVHFSSDSVFSFGEDGYGLDRRIVPGELPPRPRTIYGWTKWVGECVARAAARDSNLLVLYPSFGFGGPNDGISMISAMIRGALGLPGYDRVILPLNPERYKQPTWHEDIGRFVVAAVERGLRGTHPIAGPPAMRYGAIVELVRGVFPGSTFFEDDERFDVRGVLDYKGDNLYDARATERAWRAVDSEPTPHRKAIRLEADRARRSPVGLRRHVFRLLDETLRAASGPFEPWSTGLAR
ncbi:MAG: sugar nucleotide-binding protein [Planctomycetota bacterium]|jgi:dTDP-4-dehydrorhamnose reductase